jgi:hypothetical protein
VAARKPGEWTCQSGQLIYWDIVRFDHAAWRSRHDGPPFRTNLIPTPAGLTPMREQFGFLWIHVGFAAIVGMIAALFVIN